MPGVFNGPLNSISEVCWSAILNENKTCRTLVSSCSYSASRGFWAVSLSWACKRQLLWHRVLSTSVLNPSILDSFCSDGRKNLQKHETSTRCSLGPAHPELQVQLQELVQITKTGECQPAEMYAAFLSLPCYPLSLATN